MLLWVPVFVGSVLLIDGLVIAWARGRLKRFREAFPLKPPRFRIWTVRVWLVAIQLVALPLLAFLLALPFSLERGAADAVEMASSKVVDWTIDTGKDHLRHALGITADEAFIDLSRVRAALGDKTLDTISKARGLLDGFSMLPDFAINVYLIALRRALDEVLTKDAKITWTDLIQAASAQVRFVFRAHSRIVAEALRLDSLQYAFYLILASVIVNLGTVALILAMTRSSS